MTELLSLSLSQWSLKCMLLLSFLQESQRGNSTLDLTEHGNIVGIPSSLWPRNRASLSHAPSPLRPHTPPAEHRQDPHSTSSVDSEVQALRAIAYNDEKAGLEALHVGAQASECSPYTLERPPWTD